MVAVVFVIVAVLTLTRMINQARGYGTGSSHSGVEEHPKKMK